jgi:hypothetical protein
VPTLALTKPVITSPLAAPWPAHAKPTVRHAAPSAAAVAETRRPAATSTSRDWYRAALCRPTLGPERAPSAPEPRHSREAARRRQPALSPRGLGGGDVRNLSTYQTDHEDRAASCARLDRARGQDAARRRPSRAARCLRCSRPRKRTSSSDRPDKRQGRTGPPPAGFTHQPGTASRARTA